MKVAVFDFCDTIVNFQTADNFVLYVSGNTQNKRIKKRRFVINAIKGGCIIKKIDKKTGGKFSLCKRMVLWQLRGITVDELNKCAEDYYEKEIVPNMYADMLELVVSHQKDGYLVYISSGGYDVYIERFAKEYGLDGCFCTKLKYKNGIFTGRMDGKDCMRENKTEMLNAYFSRRPEQVIAYSDSKSDLPLLMWADNGVVVSRKIGREWPKEYGLREHILSGVLVKNLLGKDEEFHE